MHANCKYYCLRKEILPGLSHLLYTCRSHHHSFISCQTNYPRQNTAKTYTYRWNLEPFCPLYFQNKHVRACNNKKVFVWLFHFHYTFLLFPTSTVVGVLGRVEGKGVTRTSRIPIKMWWPDCRRQSTSFAKDNSTNYSYS